MNRANDHVFPLKQYSSAVLILALLGLVLLGTLTVFILQYVCSIPSWLQYVVLTLLIATAFFVSSCLAARPASIRLGQQVMTIEQDRQAGKDAETIRWDDIEAYAYYEELLLYSLKISLRGNETVSIIDFKWDDNVAFRDFLEGFESHLKTSDESVSVCPARRSETFYGSKKRTAIGAALFVVYVGVVVTLLARDAFASWNPIALYYFWLLPATLFVKLLKAK